MDLYEEQDYGAALTEFKKAYELSPSYKLLYKIGQVSYKLRDYPGAFRAFEKYLVEGGDRISQQRRAEVQEEINLLKEQIGKVEVTSNVLGAQVSIDDVPVGTTPLDEPILVSVGERRITVRAEGRQAVTQAVTVAGQEVRSLKFDLPALARETKAVHQRESASKMTTWSWVGVGAAGALGLGAAITGIMTTNASDDLSEMSYVGSTPSDEIKDQQAKVDNLALTTDILAGAAIVALGTTLFLTFSRPDAPREFDAEKQPAAKHPRIQPMVGLESVGLTGEF
ncbi:MAG: PEGA domain-containing protein [Polyangiaceae bacterium]|nr:PEGA domain-containing protein [Polyangiaceae bacterium]